MADNFDELIKGKFEEKQFEYSGKAWRSFSKKNGWSVISAPAKIAISVISAITIGSIAFYIATEKVGETTSHEATPQPTATQQNTMVENVADTFDTAQEAPATPQPSEKTTSKRKITDNQGNNISDEKDNGEIGGKVDTMGKHIKPAPRPEEPSNWKVNIINVDTIR